MSASHDSAASKEPRPPALARICKKLVLNGQASSKGAFYTLYLKVEVPANPKPHTYPLLPDHDVRLKEAVVHQLDAAGAAPALSESAASAASHLGIPLSVHHHIESPPLASMDDRLTPSNARRRSFGTTRRAQDPFSVATAAKVSVANFHINFIAPPLTTPLSPTSSNFPGSTSTRQLKRKDVCGFILILRFEVGLTASPPRGPHTVRLFKPYCLNNYLKFALDDSVNLGTGDIAVEIDPLVLPRSRSQRKALNRPKPPAEAEEDDDDDDAITLGPNSDDSDDDDGGNTTVQGPFESCEAVVVRWAAPKAGDFSCIHPRSHVIPAALRADFVTSRVRYQPCSAANDGHIILWFEATAKVSGLHFPGLDSEACLPIVLDAYGQQASWEVSQVEASPGLVSWSQQQQDHLATKDELKASGVEAYEPTSRIPTETAGANHLRRVISTDSLGDDDDLLNVDPPSGLSDTDIDFSFDTMSIPSRPRARRRSIVSRGGSRPATPRPEEDDADNDAAVERPNTEPAHECAVRLQLDVLQVTKAGAAIELTLRGTVTLKSKQGQLSATSNESEEELRLALPVLRFTTALEHFSSIEPDSEAPPDSAYVVAGFRRSQWTGSDGWTKLEPFAAGKALPPGHGFDPEANVVTVKAGGRDDPSPAAEDTAADEGGDLRLLSDARAVSQELRQPLLPATAAAPVAAAAGPDLAMAPMLGSAWSQEASFSVRPMFKDAGRSTVAVRLQLDWPSSRGTLLPFMSLKVVRLASATDIVVAFVNGRQVQAAPCVNSSNEAPDEAGWPIALPSYFAAGSSPVRADVLFSMPWDGQPDIAISLPRIPWNVMSVTVDLAGDLGRQPKLLSPKLSSSFLSQTYAGRLQLSSFYLEPRTALDLEYTLESVSEAAAALSDPVPQVFRVEDNQSFQSPGSNGGASSEASVLANSRQLEPVEPSQRSPSRRGKKQNETMPHWPSPPHLLSLYLTSISIALMSFFVWHLLHTLRPNIEDLDAKVRYLATAQRIDFCDGIYGVSSSVEPNSDSLWRRRLLESMPGMRPRKSRHSDAAKHRLIVEQEIEEQARRKRKAEGEEVRRRQGKAGSITDMMAEKASWPSINDVDEGQPTMVLLGDPEESRHSLSLGKVDWEEWTSERTASKAEQQHQQRQTPQTVLSGKNQEAASHVAPSQEGDVALATSSTGSTGALSMLMRVLGWPLRRTFGMLRMFGRALWA